LKAKSGSYGSRFYLVFGEFMRYFNFVALVFTLFVTGCASGPFSANRDIEASSQQLGTVVYCNGYKTWDDCNRYAKQTCPNGFEVISRDENLPTQNRSLRISCK
jgi:hypothetical protein